MSEEIRKIREKRKTIISVISVSVFWGIVLGFIISMIVLNPLQVNAMDISQFKQNTLRSPVTIVLFWAMLPQGFIIALAFYKIGRSGERRNWLKNQKPEIREILEKQKFELKNKTDREYEKDRTINRLKNLVKRQAEILDNVRAAAASSITYEELTK